MTPDAFFASLSAPRPPDGLSDALRALWWCARGDWDAAHGIAQDDHSRNGSWVHAHLHRVEGDLGNAGYWYARAGRPANREPLETERLSIVEELLTK